MHVCVYAVSVCLCVCGGGFESQQDLGNVLQARCWQRSMEGLF